MDADLQHPPDVIPTLLEAWRQGYDVVHTRKIETAELGGLRRVLTHVAYRAIGATASVEFIAQASDFRLFDAHACSERLRSCCASPTSSSSSWRSPSARRSHRDTSRSFSPSAFSARST